MSIFEFEKSIQFGFLDSSAFTDGYPLDAYRLSVIAKNHNTLRDEREPVLAVPFDAKSDSNFVSNIGAFVARSQGNGWVPIFWPMPFMKRPHAKKIEVHIYGLAENLQYHIQCVTNKTPFRPQAKVGDENVASLLTAATSEYVTCEVPVSGSAHECLMIFGKGSRDETLGDDSTYGRNADDLGVGTEFVVSQHRLTWAFAAPAATDIWEPMNYTDDNYSRGHRIVFTDQNGIAVTTPRKITSLWRPFSTADEQYMDLCFSPELSESEVELLNANGSWKIVSQSAFRINSIAAYEAREI